MPSTVQIGRKLLLHFPICLTLVTIVEGCPGSADRMLVETTTPAEDAVPQEQESQAVENPRTGADAMRDAADKKLFEDCEKIAKGLSAAAQNGHILAARLLYLISCERMRLTAEEIKQRKSLAAEWEAEEEWRAEMQIGTAETGSGSREPE